MIKVLLPKLKGKFYRLTLKDQGYYRYIFRRTQDQIFDAFKEHIDYYHGLDGNKKYNTNKFNKRNSEFYSSCFGSSYMGYYVDCFEVVNASGTFLDSFLEEFPKEYMFNLFKERVFYSCADYVEKVGQGKPPPGFKLTKKEPKKTVGSLFQTNYTINKTIVWKGTKEEFNNKFLTPELLKSLTDDHYQYFLERKYKNYDCLKPSESTKEPDLTKPLVYFHGDGDVVEIREREDYRYYGSAIENHNPLWIGQFVNEDLEGISSRLRLYFKGALGHSEVQKELNSQKREQENNEEDLNRQQELKKMFE